MFTSTNKSSSKGSGHESTHTFIRDMWAILLFALGLIFFCALVSYAPGDQLYLAGQQEKTANWIGPGGFLAASFLYDFLGAQAFFWPFALFFAAFLCFSPRIIEGKLRRGFALVLIFLSISIFLDLGLASRMYNFPAGGLLGVLMSQALLKVISVTGSIIVASAWLLIGLLLFTGWSLKSMLAASKKAHSENFGTFALKSALLTKPSPMPTILSPILDVENNQSDISEASYAPSENSTVKIIDVSEDEYSTQNSDSTIPQGAAIFYREKNSQIPVEEGRKSSSKNYCLPPLNLLDYDAPLLADLDEKALTQQGERLCATFRDFGIFGEIREIRPGPVVTLFEFVPAAGIKLSRISALSDDIAMAMEAVHVRIVAPIPGKGAVGIELPNEKRETVYLKEIVADPAYRARSEKLLIALGKDISGKPCYANLAEMPHLLIAGTTGSGKSIGVNAMICSILYRAAPDEVKFLMIDPKMLELSIYAGIPHLLLPPIVDSKKAAIALAWAVREMERRYLEMSQLGVRDISGYNLKMTEQNEPAKKMPYIVIVVDEYADLVSVAGKEIEAQIMRLAQKARACGMHVILATQRPSVDIITGVIKANFPVRIGFRLASVHDSKTIINRSGAEKLLGRGDMLFMPAGTSDIFRVHGAYISEKELKRVIDFCASQGDPHYQESIIEQSSVVKIADL